MKVTHTFTEAYRIERRRQCKNDNCLYILTSQEVVVPQRLRVIKRHKPAEYFDITKVRRSIKLAYVKLDIAPDKEEADVQAVVAKIVDKAKKTKEVTSEYIGKEVIKQIADNDFALVRYGAHYIKDRSAFKELKKTIEKFVED